MSAAPTSSDAPAADRLRAALRALVATAGTAAAYAVAGWLALQLRVPPDYAIVVFFPAGVAAGAALVVGWTALPGVLIGSLAVQAMAHQAVGADWRHWGVLAPALGATAMAAWSAWAVRRWVGYPSALDEPPQVLRLLFIVLPASSLINASVAVPALVWHGVIAPGDAWIQWTAWWLGDALGAVLLVPLALVLLGQPRDAWRARRWSVGVPLALALGLAATVVHVLAAAQTERLRMRVEQIGHQAAQTVQRRLDAQLDALQALGQLLARDPHLDPVEFEHAAGVWLRRYPGTQNFAYNWRVRHAERHRYECCEPGWPIMARDAQGQRWPAPAAEEYLVITRVAPVDGNTTALGLDVWSYEPLRRAVQAALDSGQPRATEPIRLVQEPGRQRGVVIYHAVREPTGEHDWIGVVSSALRLDDMLRTTLEPLPLQGLAACLIDLDAAERPQRLAGPEGCEAAASEAPLQARTAWPLRLAQRSWLLQLDGTAAFWRQSAADTRLHLTASLGFLAVALLGAFVLVTTGQQRRVEQLVRERTLELAHSHAQLQQLAHYDTLTGLVNRQRWAELARSVLDSARQQGREVAVAYLDLDRFKHVNDSLGHAQGDRLLQAVAARLQACLRARDVPARFGGDEFVVLLPWVKGREAAAVVARKIVRALDTSIELDGARVRIGASLGVALYPHDATDLETLLRHADTAMYAAKAAGRNQWRFFEPSMHAQVSRRLALESALREALADPPAHGLYLVYQPQVDACAGQLVGVEALLRWQHPQLGALTPAEFVRMAEEAGIIEPLSTWVLHEALAQLARWRAQSPAWSQVRVAVNVSAHEFASDLPLRVQQALDAAGLPATALELEITESLLVHASHELTQRLQALQTLGVRLSLDDFGTGYSSLGYLKRLPIGTLKIDRGFVEGIPTDADSVAIVRATLSMAHDLGLTVVAEGVETSAQRDFLCQHGCCRHQGWLYAPALSALQLPAWLEGWTSQASHS
ncbi:putative signaling protein [Tepidimonas alkaliphilus]|uniref:Putative signaling protein n=1 Tax=Tepidimonas alkaliphilus TaxID=2588942 RepID=A0A554W4D2_9BURK|nr:EAL domain-containing protein [Tepidimonas alkaliphilus]TSE18422.1 putative signaling protein [Tepidimonas alkaliphilus]